MMHDSVELSRISRGPSLGLHFDKGRLAAQGWGGIWDTRERKRIQKLVMVPKDGHRGGNLELIRNDEVGNI